MAQFSSRLDSGRMAPTGSMVAMQGLRHMELEAESLHQMSNGQTVRFATEGCLLSAAIGCLFSAADLLRSSCQRSPKNSGATVVAEAYANNAALASGGRSAVAAAIYATLYDSVEHAAGWRHGTQQSREIGSAIEIMTTQNYHHI